MSHKKPEIFIIDDDQVVLFLHKILVKKGGLCDQPNLFLDAEAALKTLATLDTSDQKVLIFLDINMPKMDGWGFLTELEILIQQADIQVIMITSSLSQSDRQKSKEFKVVRDFWEKPMEATHISSLKEELSEWLGGN